MRNRRERERNRTSRSRRRRLERKELRKEKGKKRREGLRRRTKAAREGAEGLGASRDVIEQGGERARGRRRGSMWKRSRGRRFRRRRN